MLLANAGLPLMLCLTPLAIFTLPLIILVEFLYYKQKSVAPVTLKEVTFANIVTSVIGIPMLTALMTLVCIIPIPDEAPPTIKTLLDGFTRTFWSLPGKPDHRVELVARFGICAYLAGCMIISAYCERWMIIRKTPGRKLDAATCIKAHLLSYAAMFLGVMLIGVIRAAGKA